MLVCVCRAFCPDVLLNWLRIAFWLLQICAKYLLQRGASLRTHDQNGNGPFQHGEQTLFVFVAIIIPVVLLCVWFNLLCIRCVSNQQHDACFVSGLIGNHLGFVVDIVDKKIDLGSLLMLLVVLSLISD